jgi:lipopolysaccharide/colanic/teichoic acid biosynthesis glycosyltransferase
MSLVGPRPATPSIVERYAAEPRELLDVEARVTGPTQQDSLDAAAWLPRSRRTFTLGEILGVTHQERPTKPVV